MFCTPTTVSLMDQKKTRYNKSLKSCKHSKLSITVEGDLGDFLRVSIERKKDGVIHMTQPHLIEQILGDLIMLDESVKPRCTPAASLKVLTRHSQSPNFDGSFKY